MRKFRIGSILFAVIIIIGQITLIDYSNLIWSRNAGSYLGIFAMICVILSMIFSNRYEKRKLNKEN
jgi:hypothetical protein